MSDNSPDTSTNTNAAAPTEPPLTNLMCPRMMPGEDPADFERLAARVIAHVQPRGGVEELLVGDYLYESWQVLRLRRYKDIILRVHGGDGIVTVVEPLVGGDKEAEEIACDWYAGADGAAEKLNCVLASAGLTLDAAMAETLAANLELYHDIDGLLETAERRRSTALRELEHQRVVLALRAKEVMREVEEGDYRVLPDFTPVGGDARLKSP